jgi:branched-chain amino acid transport system ATP-binding protein
MTTTMSAEPAVIAQGVEVGYGGAPVLKGISFHVDRGEVVALVGPNGAGKTTLLRTISGLLRPSGGAVSLLGRPVDLKRPERNAWRGLAHVPDGRGLLGDLSVEENLLLARGERVSRKHLLQRAHQLFPQLDKILGRKAKLLSGGEQQMVAVARAVIRRPPVLVIDELSLGLSPQRSRELLQAVKAAAAEQSTAVLLVEQHVKMALEFADRVSVLVAGQIVIDRTSDQLSHDSEELADAYLGAASP